MPVWHDATRKLREEGTLQLVGLTQEQHPDRCKLFMQWKQMDWPVLVDPLNLLEVTVVPLALLIDERGVVREVLRDPRKAAEKLTAELEADTPPATTASSAAERAPTGIAATLRRSNEALLLTDKPRFDDVIKTLNEALQGNAENGALHFARGVAYRMRYDSPERRDGDFAAAVADWQRALDLNPNQYIWRRRIQQYGPRLDKPYPFYDWVDAARREIRARGETPVALSVDPAGAELAAPAKKFSQAATQPDEPDPAGRITRDTTPLASAEITVVPPRIRPGQAARVHIVLRPNPRAGGHWNNEGEPLVVWVNPPAGWSVSDRQLTVANPPQPVSDEPRSIEFEVHAPADASAGAVELSGYALFGVCEGTGGACLYRRADLVAKVEVAGAR
ncbi:MAG: thioredoxin family protein [Phycisphaerales bacterium]|nr:thioredoxin family protein [Phycisphaerales bacterium]